MTHEEFISLVRQPENVRAEHVSDLKEMVERYPYFVSSRLLYVKSLQQSHSVHFAGNIKPAALYSASRRWFYYYLYPEKMLSAEPYRKERIAKSGDYFDMLNTIEAQGGDTKQSLKSLAERLKSARSMVHVPVAKKAEKVVSEVTEKNENEPHEPTPILMPEKMVNSSVNSSYLSDKEEYSEENAKKLISEKKYRDAIEILKGLNLNNPKKSVYFADQIRFLEKVIANSKK